MKINKINEETKEKLQKFFFEEKASAIFFAITSIIIMLIAGFCLYTAKIRVSVCDWPLWLALTLSSGGMAIASVFASWVLDSRWEANTLSKVLGAVTAFCLLTLLFGTIGTSPLFQAKNLHDEVAPYVQKMDESAFPNLLGKNNDPSNLPLYGEAEALKKAETEMGKYPALGSQFRLDKDELTSQNFNGKLVYVIPLEPIDMFKWNSEKGAPGFFIVNRNNGNVDFIDKPFFTTTAAPWGDNVVRIANNYLDKNGISGLTTDPSPEVDNENNLHFVTTVYEKKGFLGGYKKILGVVDTNAHTKESKFYPFEEVPEWIDRVIPEEFFLNYLGDYGSYGNGFWNSVFAKSGVQIMTSDSFTTNMESTSRDGEKKNTTSQTYDVIYIDGTCFYYTGWTSAGKEGATNGIMMMNSRTGDIQYYSTYGISEGKSQSVVEGLVSDKGYQATYPLLLQVAGEETYFHLMRDENQNLVGYAFCNYKDYQKAGFGTSINDAEAAYIKALGKTSSSEEFDTKELSTVEGSIEALSTEVLDGNTIYYIKVDGVSDIFSAYSKVNIDLVFAKVGDKIKIEYYKSKDAVQAIKNCNIN